MTVQVGGLPLVQVIQVQVPARTTRESYRYRTSQSMPHPQRPVLLLACTDTPELEPSTTAAAHCHPCPSLQPSGPSGPSLPHLFHPFLGHEVGSWTVPLADRDNLDGDSSDIPGQPSPRGGGASRL